MNAVTAIKIRNCKTQQDTAQTLTPGGTLTEPPFDWSLSFYFIRPPIVSATMFGACFSLDGGPAVYQEAPPYVVNNKHPGVPLKLAIGEHSIAVSVDGQPAELITFNLEPSATTADQPANPPPNNPPANPPAQPVGILGTNGEGIDQGNYDPEAHPILLTTMKAIRAQIIRLWTTGQIGNPFPTSQWSISKKWAALGVKVIAVLNFQNTRGAPNQQALLPADPDWLATCHSIPDARDSGVWAIEVGGELDFTPVYFPAKGTPAQYAHLLALAYPILKAKGYIVVAGACLNSLAFYKSLPAGWTNNCDALNRHFYQETAANCDAVLDELEAFARSNGKLVVNTEGNIRNASAAQTIIEIKKLILALLARAGTHCLFPLVNIPADPKDPNAPLTVQLNQSPTYSAYLQPAA